MVAFQDGSVGPTKLVMCYGTNGVASAGNPSTSLTPFIGIPQCMAYDRDIGDVLLINEHRDPSLNGMQYNFNGNTGDAITSMAAGFPITTLAGGSAENLCAVNYLTESGTYQGSGYYIFHGLSLHHQYAEGG